MYSPRCSYCGKDTLAEGQRGNAHAGTRLDVLACLTHADLAKRDARAYMHKNGTVRRWDVLEDPVFEALGFSGDRICSPGTPLKNLTVKRSNGALEPGWSFVNFASINQPLDLRRSTSGHWVMAAEGPGDVQKGIRVDEFTLSLPEDQHHLVAAFVARLDTIYKADADAHDAAVLGAVAVA